MANQMRMLRNKKNNTRSDVNEEQWASLVRRKLDKIFEVTGYYPEPEKQLDKGSDWIPPEILTMQQALKEDQKKETEADASHSFTGQIVLDPAPPAPPEPFPATETAPLKKKSATKKEI